MEGFCHPKSVVQRCAITGFRIFWLQTVLLSTKTICSASQPNNFSPLSLSARQSSSCLWGLVLACGLAALAGSRSGTSSTPSPLLFPAHTCLCVCPCWGHFRRTVGVMRSQTALNGPKQAVQINNLLRLQSSRQEQHSVKCQQQTP